MLSKTGREVVDGCEEGEEEEEEEYGDADRRWNQPGALERYADAAFFEELDRGLRDGTYQEIVSAQCETHERLGAWVCPEPLPWRPWAEGSSGRGGCGAAGEALLTPAAVGAVL